MRDPDLVTRAQRAAVALERAWERWRAMHGLSAEPMPPVSSYVGYSIAEPWGRPRVVFGVDAREAELLAALLDHHECVGPFYQADPAEAGFGPGPSGSAGIPLDEARSRIPAQAQAAEEQPRHDERPRQRRGQDSPPGTPGTPGSPAGPDATAGGTGGEQSHDGDRRSPATEPGGESGATGLTSRDESGSAGRAGDQRRGRRGGPGRPGRRERRAAGRQRSGPREAAAGVAGPGYQARDAGRDDAGAPGRSTGYGGTGYGGTAPGGTGYGGTAYGGKGHGGSGHGGGPSGAAGSGLGTARDASPGPAPDAGPDRDTGRLPGAGQGLARDASSAPNAGAPRNTGTQAGAAPASSAPAGAAPAGAAPAGAAPARAARRGLPGDFGPDPLGVGGGGATGDFLAAPTGSSILTASPRQDNRTARPAVATETIAAELAGWAAGELPGQASARLAAWAAIGGVPAPGYRSTDSSDVGAAGVGSERVR